MVDHILNKKHALDPKPGDYWQEMLCAVCVVLAVDNTHVTICKHKKDVDRNHWTWDLAHITTMSRNEFYRWLEYDTIPNKFWCCAEPEKHKWAIEEYRQLHNITDIDFETYGTHFWQGHPI